MKSLKKVLLGLLLIGISINLDLNAGKRGAPYAYAPEYKLKAERNAKAAKVSEEQDVADVIIAQQDESDDEEGGDDVFAPALGGGEDAELQCPVEGYYADQDDEENDRVGLLALLEYEAGIAAIVAQPEVEHRFRFPRGLNLGDLAAYFPSQAVNGALVVFSAGDLIATYLPVGVVTHVALDASKVASAYLVLRAGQWVVNNPEARRFVRAKRQQVCEVANEIPAQAKRVAKKVKRAARDRGCSIQ